jgi:hypothetical protein
MISSVGYAEFCLDLHCRPCVRLCIGVVGNLVEHVVVFWLVMMTLARQKHFSYLHIKSLVLDGIIFFLHDNALEL